MRVPKGQAEFEHRQVRSRHGPVPGVNPGKIQIQHPPYRRGDEHQAESDNSESMH